MNLGTLIHRNIFKKSISICYGIGINHLDIESMQYKMFAAVWKHINGYRYIIGYWFSDNKEHLMAGIYSKKWTNLLRADEQISEVYEVIREKQEKNIWNKRMKLTDGLDKWLEKQPGWYVIKSSKNFPCTITCVQKTRHTVWIEHVGICETHNDMKRLINIINLEHNIHLM